MAENVSLTNIDAEFSLVGTLLLDPAVMQTYGDDIDANWISDDTARWMLQAAQRVHAGGGQISRQAVLAQLPENANEQDPLTLFKLFAGLCDRAVSSSQILGLINVVKDRWARRSLAAATEFVAGHVRSYDMDPYVLSQELVAQIDNINASKGEKATGSLYESFDLLFASHTGASLRGATTGLESFDSMANGYRAGQLYVIAGRPGMGKSAFMCSSLRRTAAAGNGVAVFSLEMTREEIAARCAADAFNTVNGPFFGSILKDLMNATEREKLSDIMADIRDHPFHVDASARLTFAEISARARKLKTEYETRGIKLAVVCIDHMGLVTPSDRYRGNKVAEAGEVSAMSRALAKELDCCVILLCQLSRDVEKRDDKRPVMSDLRWSGEIEQDAHVIVFLYREAYYLEMEQDADPNDMMRARNAIELLVRKNRNGATGDLRLWCSIAHSSIRDQ